jgi:hypothetical protein
LTIHYLTEFSMVAVEEGELEAAAAEGEVVLRTL